MKAVCYGLESRDAGQMMHGDISRTSRFVSAPSIPSVLIRVYILVCLHVCVFNHPSPVCRLVHQDGSLADLTMLSASSVEATPTRDEQEPQEEHSEWGAECKEQPLVVLPTADMIGEKTRIFSEQRQSSTDESYHCSAGTEPEPSTEQSSGNKHANLHIYNAISSSPKFIHCIHSRLVDIEQHLAGLF